jgi:NAD(P)-dependent dehydrogenase (short-subunit alcohol dehydrogenase family)
MNAHGPSALPARRLAGKVAIITGAGAGIGRAAATAFARAGAAVVVADIAEESGASVVEEVMIAGGNAVFVHTDVASSASVETCVSRAIDSYGRLDILYNNAGGSSAEDGKVTDVSPDAFARVMALNLLGTWLFCHYAIPAMIRSGGGSLINTSSALALGMQAGGRHAYTAAKGGVVSLTRAIAFDYARQRIRANVIAPGFTASERVARDVAALPHLTRRLDEQHPLGYGQPQGVAHLALYLASDESAQTTGQVFAVNNEVIG